MKNNNDFFKNLSLEYYDMDSLSYKKIKTVDSYIKGGKYFLDIGTGTGELIDLEKSKFDFIVGIDSSEESLKICREKFEDYDNINMLLSDVKNLDYNDGKFDYITACDVLEHIELEECKKALEIIFKLLKKDGIFIFTGPGIFEKVKIKMGRSPDHLHSHSSYGWKRMIENVGFKIISMETIEFPIIKSDFLRKNLHLFGKCCLIVAIKG